VVTSGPDHDLEKIEFVILQALSARARSVKIMTPYFLAGLGVIPALSLEPTTVGVESPGYLPEHSKSSTSTGAHCCMMGPLLKARGPCPDLAGPVQSLSKLMTVVTCGRLVASAPIWDVRSFPANFELDIRCQITPGSGVPGPTELIIGTSGQRLSASNPRGSFVCRCGLPGWAPRGCVVPYLWLSRPVRIR